MIPQEMQGANFEDNYTKEPYRNDILIKAHTLPNGQRAIAKFEIPIADDMDMGAVTMSLEGKTVSVWCDQETMVHMAMSLNRAAKAIKRRIKAMQKEQHAQSA